MHKASLDAEEQAILEFTHQGIKAMADACKARGIRFVIAIIPFPPQVSAFRNASTSGQELNFDYDGHLSPHGHAVAARTLLPLIEAALPPR